MEQRKRSSEYLLPAPRKRARSTLPVKRKSVWGQAAAALLHNSSTQEASQGGEVLPDRGIEEAIAALLEIGQDSSSAITARRTERSVVEKAKPVLFQDSTERLHLQSELSPAKCMPSASVRSQSEPAIYRWPTVSSASDESTTAAVSLPVDLGNARNSFDSICCLPGAGGQQRILRQEAVQLLQKEPVEVTVNCPKPPQPQNVNTVPNSIPKLIIRVDEPSAVPSSLLHSSSTSKHMHTAGKTAVRSKGNAAAIIGPKTGSNVVSTGAPLPAIRIQEIPSSSRIGISVGSDLGRSYSSQLGSEASAQPRPEAVAPRQGSKLIVVTAPSAACGAKQGPQIWPGIKSQSLGTGRLATQQTKQPRNQVQSALLKKPKTLTNKAGSEKSLWRSTSSPTAASNGPESTCSGDDSSDELYQPNWGLELFSALNPSVITTGHCNFKEPT